MGAKIRDRGWRAAPTRKGKPPEAPVSDDRAHHVSVMIVYPPRRTRMNWDQETAQHVLDIEIQGAMQRRKPIALLAVMIFVLSLWAGCMEPKEKPELDSTTVILIRHVERDNFFIVTPEGHERALALVEAVKDMGITAIYSPDLQRNLDTVTPLATHLAIKITLTPRFTNSTIDKLVGEILIKHRGEVILLVGNGAGNLRTLHQRLGGTGEGPYSYGDLFIYTIRNIGPVKVTKSRYGS